jgi:hypothetical protein
MKRIVEIGRRLLIAALTGAFIGALELFFYDVSGRRFMAVVSAGAVYGLFLGTIGSRALRKPLSGCMAGILAGAFAGVVRWLIAGPEVYFLSSLCIGAALGLSFVLGDRPWRAGGQRSIMP